MHTQKMFYLGQVTMRMVETQQPGKIRISMMAYQYNKVLIDWVGPSSFSFPLVTAAFPRLLSKGFGNAAGEFLTRALDSSGAFVHFSHAS